MNASNLKRSKQREAIKSYLMGQKNHPTADMVYTAVRQEFPNISLGTVYRNLTLLSDIGEILRLNIGDGVDRFDATTEPHYHFICRECGNVIDLDVDAEALSRITTVAAKNFSGQIVGHTTHFYGLCENCCKNAACHYS